jgi:hypothetical protein
VLQDKARDFDLKMEIVEYISGSSGYVISGYQFRGLRSCNFSFKSKALFALVNFRDLKAVLRCIRVRFRFLYVLLLGMTEKNLDNLIMFYSKIGLKAFLPVMLRPSKVVVIQYIVLQCCNWKYTISTLALVDELLSL